MEIRLLEKYYSAYLANTEAVPGCAYFTRNMSNAEWIYSQGGRLQYIADISVPYVAGRSQRGYIIFEDEKLATLFMLKWS